ncbi:DUF2489 domain-containing protein [Simiduia sp. 21SJ11W-1]|uniref:DUF2489 domain-containing protein n=1 Tax=Simiduia sp. 21SJ11W-1 TaxID=2909669 RepID=UPI00209E6DB1|nr:DUF2489 domain-containing protein [Simiduia sp. 21SJ11W-1]UTA46357.1 DUF2489 domain-containing protein [Simiduia sp. 21SJ11W-1]
MIYLVVLAVAIVLGLAGYAAYLALQVRRQNQDQQARLAELEGVMEDEKTKRINSIRILAQGVLKDELSYTEAAIRITALLDILGEGKAARETHVALYKLADETLHIPRLADWRALDKKTKRRYDKERAASEAKYREFIQDSAKQLVSFSLSDAAK